MTKPPPMPFPKMVGSIKDFIAERDAVLLKGDMLEVARFFKKYNPNYDCPELKEEVMEIALHKARTGSLSLPKEVRKASHKWLKDRGYGSLADFTDPIVAEENTDGEKETEVQPAPGVGSNPDDPANPEPEQPVVDEASDPGGGGETPTG